MIAYSRYFEGEKTSRNERLEQEAKPEVGFVSYFNTDMYDFGIGLDIRESPKDFGSKFRTVLDRLGIFRKPDGAHWQIGGDCHFGSTFSQIIGNEEILDVRLKGDLGSEVPVLLGDGLKDYRPKHSDGAPLSSGENQVFFLCLLLRALRPKNSILFLDEADLHLAIPSCLNLVHLLIDIAERENCQIFMVTHMPILLESRLRNHDRKSWNDGDVALYYMNYNEEILFFEGAAEICRAEYYSTLDEVRRQEIRPETDYRIIRGLKGLLPF